MLRWLPGRAPARAWDDLQFVGLKLIFLMVTRTVSLLGLSRRERWWKDAEILMLRHQLAVAQRERPGRSGYRQNPFPAAWGMPEPVRTRDSRARLGNPGSLSERARLTVQA
jgi:hypothetical protein